ncbi:30S ribosomal protein S1 [Brockia lithotrophica]|uniref:SSU ribosomal protein S1P n=1 Tax=Brockia lithotrophica TaxID=933949 RepID=A0A660L5D4_9BACL|nr:30S ribosomal protein S1 [Brockia lithotrophica]RKQ88414.1 SSU ribosomal protein S1P [Brockia lithotrophica]
MSFGQEGFGGNLHVGEVVEGVVTRVEAKHAMVDLGDGREAILPIREVSALHIESVSDVLRVGDRVRVEVVKVDPVKQEIVVSKRAVDAREAWQRLADLFDRDETFEVTIFDAVKGGLVADVGLRGFIPASQVGERYVEDLSVYKGKRLPVKVLELDPEQNRVILSHRIVVEEEKERRREEALARLVEGEVLEGTVVRIVDFGAFVDLGGVDGLVHISELSWDPVDDPRQVVKEGDRVRVKVLKVDRETGRISLSLRETQPGPWDTIAEHFHEGDVVEGVVKRLAPFGAFVEIVPGVEGLVHVSQVARRRVSTPHEVLHEGDRVRVKILSISPEERRISLSIREAEGEPVSGGGRRGRGEREAHAAQEKDESLEVSIRDLIQEDLRDKLF